jgi:hypothetical protein
LCLAIGEAVRPADHATPEECIAEVERRVRALRAGA